MGYYDGAGVCKVVGNYILNKPSNIIDKDLIGLCRNDRFGIFENLSEAQIERKKTNIMQVFKKYGLSIIVKTNIISVDFLDVTFSLKTESYQPLRKPNDEPKYIDITNHPPENFQSQSRKDYPKYRHLRKYLIIQNPCMKKLYKRAASKKNYVITKGM